MNTKVNCLKVSLLDLSIYLHIFVCNSGIYFYITKMIVYTFSTCFSFLFCFSYLMKSFQDFILPKKLILPN